MLFVTAFLLSFLIQEHRANPSIQISNATSLQVKNVFVFITGINNVVYQLTYDFPANDTDYAYFSLSVNTTGWFALGFGDGMRTATDIWLFEVDPTKSTVKVSDCFGTSYDGPSYDVENGGTNDLIVLSSEYNVNGQTTVAFKHLKNSGDKHDQIFNQTQYKGMVAFGNADQYTVEFHGTNIGQFSLTMEDATCPTGQAIIDGSCKASDLTPLGNSFVTHVGVNNTSFEVQYEFPKNDSNYVYFQIITNTSSWFALGFGTGMKKATDMWLFEVNPDNGVVNASDCYGQSYSGPTFDVNSGGKNDLVLLGYKYNVNGTTAVKFKRLLDTGDQYDQVLSQTSFSGMIAYGLPDAFTVQSHKGNKALLTFNLVDTSCPQGQVLIDNVCVVNDLVPLRNSFQQIAGVNNTYFNVQYVFPENDSTNVYFLIETNTTGWFGFGIGTGMQTATDIWVFEVDPVKKTVSASDCFGKDYNGPAYDVENGGTNDIHLVGYEYDTNGKTSVKFRRQLNTGDAHDQILSKSAFQGMVAFGAPNQYTVDYHDTDYAQFSFDLYQSQCPEGQVFINGFCLQNDISPLNNSFTRVVGPNYTQFEIQYEFPKDQPDYVYFQIVQNTTGWFGFGIGDAMGNATDMWIFEIDPVNKVINSTDCFGSGYKGPAFDVNNGGTQDILIVGYQYNVNSKTQVKFKRKLNTGDSHDQILSQTSFKGMIAFGVPFQYTLKGHKSNYGQFDFSLVESPCPQGQVIIDGGCVINDLVPLPNVAKRYVNGTSFEIQYGYEQNDTNIYFQIITNSSSWFALGFGPDMRNATDMWVFQIDNQTFQVNASDGFGKDYSGPQYDVLYNGTNDLKLLGYKFNESGVTAVKFKRQLNTTDIYDQVLNKSVFPAMLAFGVPGQLSVHFHRGNIDQFNLDLAESICPYGQVFIDGACVQNDLDPLPNTVTRQVNNATFEIQYGYQQNDTNIYFQIITNSSSWFALGFGPDMRNATDMWVFQIDNQTFQVNASDGFGKDYSGPQYDVLYNGTNDLKLLGYKFNESGVTAVKFKRQLNTTDIYDQVLNKSVFPAMLAFGVPGQLSVHFHRGNVDQFNLNLAESRCQQGFVLIDGVCVENDLTPLQSEFTYNFNESIFFTLQFQFPKSSSDNVTLILITNTPSWFSLGFGTGMQSATDMWIFQIDNATNNIWALDGFGQNYTGPSIDTDFGGKNDLQLLGYEYYTNNVTKVKFQRPLDTKDVRDQILSSGVFDAMIAFGGPNDKELTYHDSNKAKFKLNLTDTSCKPDEIFVGGKCIKNDLKELTSYSLYKNADGSVYINFTFTIPQNNSNADPYVTMMIVTNTLTWFAFGFGPQMSKAQDIWLFEIDKFGAIIASDCFADSYTGPSYDVQRGGQDNLEVLGYEFNNQGVTRVKFRRLVDTADQYDTVLNEGDRQGMIAFSGHSSRTLDKHGGNKAVFQFEFKEGSQNNVDEPYDWWYIHLYTNIILWGIIVDIPIVIARYFKTYSWYINVHGFLLTLIIIASLFAEITMIFSHWSDYTLSNFQEKDFDYQLHVVLGTMLAILIAVQLIGGWLLGFLISTSLLSTNSIPSMKTVHMVSGIIIYLIGKVNVIYGCVISFPGETTEFDILNYVAYTITFFWRLILEYAYQNRLTIMFVLLRLDTRSKVKNQQVQYSVGFDSKTSITSNAKLINAIDQLDVTEIETELSHKKWAIFNNSVIDLTKSLHPGGQFIWEKVYGREISRFIYGAYGLESTDNSPYKHTPYAMKMLEKLTVGRLKVIPLFQDEDTDFQPWRIASRQVLTDTTVIFEFQRVGGSFTTQLTGIENFGRHFILRSYENKKIALRPYTMILCMARSNQEFRANILSILAKELNLHELSSRPPHPSFQFKQQYDLFPLIIKRYQSPTGFSQYIHSLSNGDTIEMSGPFGTSFQIDQKDQGHLVIIAAGTGLFPFLDLLDFFFRKTVVQIAQKEFPSEVPNLNPLKQDYDRYFQDPFKITLVLAIRNHLDMVGQDIYVTLARLQEYLPKPNFKLIIRSQHRVDSKGVINIGRAPLSHAFFNQYLEDPLAVKKYLICGPPQINKDVPETLLSMGVEQKRIHLV